MDAGINGAELNRKALREVANRIDPNTRPNGIAKFNQCTYGAFDYMNSTERKTAPECMTACCVAGHAHIVANGVESYMESLRDVGDDIHAAARHALGLNGVQAGALFSTLIDAEKIATSFGIQIYNWDTTDDDYDIADLLRQIADEA